MQFKKDIKNSSQFPKGNKRRLGKRHWCLACTVPFFTPCFDQPARSNGSDRHRSRANLRRPQCGSLRSGLKMRSTWRFKAACIAARHSSAPAPYITKLPKGEHDIRRSVHSMSLFIISYPARHIDRRL
jgi:hypothetical protein